MMSRLLLSALVLLLAGCATQRTLPTPARTTDGGLKETYYQFETLAHDGKRIGFTVYQPKLAAGQTAPLVLHTHGFGLSRMKRPLASLYGAVIPTGQAAKRAWHEGYWVLSWDQRGHGDSEGEIRVADPEREIRDISTLIDWAQANLPQLAQRDGDPLIGMVGESYGGGVQYIAAARDKRIDAIVPFTTWYDLESALGPNGVPKNGWLGILNLGGDWWNWNKFDPAIRQAYRDSKEGRLTAEIYGFLNQHRLKWYCDNGQAPQADALIIQGFRDVLFNFNEALKAQQCLQAAGRDARVIGQDGGHLLPLAQSSPGLYPPVWYVADQIRCQGREVELLDLVQHWFDAKLKGDAEALAQVPTLCIDGAPVTEFAALRATESYPLPTVELEAGGRFEWLFQPLDHVGNWFRPSRLPADWAQPDSSALRPARLPLTVIQHDGWLVGVPRIQLAIAPADPQAPSTVFVHLAAWTPGSGSYRVLSEQVTPFDNAKAQVRQQAYQSLGLKLEVDPLTQEIELPAVRAELKAGEVLGLVVSSYSSQFARGGEWHTKTTLSGTLSLPKLQTESPVQLGER